MQKPSGSHVGASLRKIVFGLLAALFEPRMDEFTHVVSKVSAQHGYRCNPTLLFDALKARPLAGTFKGGTRRERLPRRECSKSY
ncbi:MAG: hypothetical protein V3S55_12920 [Nitrospiraceae bacterium]